MTTWNKAFSFPAYFFFLMYKAVIEFSCFLVILEMLIDKFFYYNCYKLNESISEIVMIAFSFTASYLLEMCIIEKVT